MHPLIAEIPVWQLPTGQSLTIRSYTFGNETNGPKAYLQAAVHGTEVQGCAVLAELIHLLAALPEAEWRGCVTLVPLANPFGVSSKVGEHGLGPFDAITGRNWNRCYCFPFGEEQHQIDLEGWLARHKNPWDRDSVQALQAEMVSALEKRLAHADRHGISGPERLALLLQRLASSASLVLDLHTSTRGNHYAYVPPYAMDHIRYLEIEDILVFGPVFGGAMDEVISVPWLKMAQLCPCAPPEMPSWIPRGITLELGGQEAVNRAAANTTAQSLLCLLRGHGVLAGSAPAPDRALRAVPESNFLSVFASIGGLMDFAVKPGDHVRVGDLLGQILDLQGNADGLPVWREVRSPYEGRVLTQFPSAVVHRGIVLYKIAVS